MSKRKSSQKRYIKTTALSDDFRRMMTPPKLESVHTPVMDYCPICLEGFDDPRTLKCKHTFCCVCLQFAINRSSKDSDSDRGFECILCGQFTKVLKYSIPRAEWADQISKDETATDQAQEDNNKTVTEASNISDSHRQLPDSWIMDWKVSEYPKSYLVDRGMDPYKPEQHRYTGQTDGDEANREETHTRNTDVDEVYDYKTGPESENEKVEVVRKKMMIHKDKPTAIDDAETCTGEAIEHGAEVGILADDGETRKPSRVSKITTATFYGVDLIVYDKGLCEVLIYDSHLTLKTAIRQRDVYSIAVLKSLLFMTSPEERCIEVLDLDNLLKIETIKLTMKCYGIGALDDRLVVLLCDNDDVNFHVSFLDSSGITGGNISLKMGYYQLNCPRQLAVCPLTRLIYVSDEKTGVVKCYNLDGHLNWEKLVYGAGALSVYNGYLLVARKFTNSVDVLSGKGVFNGRMESPDYGIISPGVISVSQDAAYLLTVDDDSLMHVFTIKKQTHVEENIIAQKSSCGCTVL